MTNPNPTTSKERASLQVPAVMRRTAQTAQRISTALAAKIAWRWFLTPYPFKIPYRERPMEKRFGTPEHFTHPRGLTYPVYTLGTGAKHVLFVHGWGGRFTQFSALLDYCEAQSPNFLEEYTLIGFNALAHRGAQGKRTMMPEFGECIQQIQECYGTFHSIIAHSLGSNAALYAQMECNTTADHQILIAPPGLISGMVGLFCDAVGFNTKSTAASSPISKKSTATTLTATVLLASQPETPYPRWSSTISTTTTLPSPWDALLAKT